MILNVHARPGWNIPRRRLPSTSSYAGRPEIPPHLDPRCRNPTPTFVSTRLTAERDQGARIAGSGSHACLGPGEAACPRASPVRIATRPSITRDSGPRPDPASGFVGVVDSPSRSVGEVVHAGRQSRRINTQDQAACANDEATPSLSSQIPGRPHGSQRQQQDAGVTVKVPPD